MELSGLAADFYNDGKEAGLEAGRIGIQRENTERMLREGMEPALIARLLAVPREQVETIQIEMEKDA